MSSANNNNLESVFMPKGRSLIYIINSNGSKTDPWGTPHVIIPQSDENFTDDSEILCQLLLPICKIELTPLNIISIYSIIKQFI
jgi:hypothetical protein